MSIQYIFEGRLLTVEDSCGLCAEHLDVLAGLVISYRMLAKDRITKAAKAQEAFIRGYLYGLEVGKTITSKVNEELYKFFMDVK